MFESDCHVPTFAVANHARFSTLHLFERRSKGVREHDEATCADRDRYLQRLPRFEGMRAAYAAGKGDQLFLETITSFFNLS